MKFSDSEVSELAIAILELVATQEDDGTWWGHDTDFGPVHEKAEELINKFIAKESP